MSMKSSDFLPVNRPRPPSPGSDSTFEIEVVMSNNGDATGWAVLERLLKAAQKFADGRKAGIPKEELEKLRLEFARALEVMDEELKPE